MTPVKSLRQSIKGHLGPLVYATMQSMADSQNVEHLCFVLPDFDGIKVDQLESADVILERVKRKAETSPASYVDRLDAINV